MQLTDNELSKAYKKDKPEFGHAMLKYYALDPEYINLNNGSYGTTPRPVQHAINELTAKIESNPDVFMRVLLYPAIQKVREQLAEFLGAKANEVVLVSNASMGLATILRNFEWEEGDIIFVFTTTYNSISRTAAYLTDIPPYPTASVITLNFPATHKDVIQTFKQHIQNHPAKPNRKRVAIIDSLVSNPGVLLPWKEMVDICREERIWSVVDAAHSIGQEVGLNLAESNPDFWVSNCHKWLSAKRSCAVLYVPERNQHIIKSSIPTSAFYISPKDRTGPNFVEQYNWNGTIDHGSMLTIPDALEFREWMGGERKINEYCHKLALEGGQLLAKVLGTRVMDPDGELTLNMVNVELPIPPNVPVTLEVHASLETQMMLEQKAYAPQFHHNGRWWTRCSAQVWNELSDFEILGKKWLAVCKDVTEQFGSQEGART
ncbi:hypothetical protein D9613_007297 [Agrocybe pediades]|uniref:Aminotransferase class V domain-containing protein n=1 Tax=Agrocybe pediades TaxID=84607 RepID=A0A8H4QGX5_9AGAR|nr:hypothetical protein D9613_007297 [Agrocybe pediades]